MDVLIDGFQVSSINPLVGLEGRVALLNKLGQSLSNNAAVFHSPARYGNMLDYLLTLSKNENGKDVINMDDLWSVISTCIFPIFPARTLLHGLVLGDVHPIPYLQGADGQPFLVPFHKLSQWLSYSLVECLERVSQGRVRIQGTSKLTGLPEYRNGGLLIDLGILKLKEQANHRGLQRAEEHAKSLPASKAANLLPMFEVTDVAIVEWRALTVALLDRIAAKVRARYNLNETEMPQAVVLEGGTWKAGREIAAEKRPQTKGPPIDIISDGTVF